MESGFHCEKNSAQASKSERGSLFSQWVPGGNGSVHFNLDLHLLGFYLNNTCNRQIVRFCCPLKHTSGKVQLVSHIYLIDK